MATKRRIPEAATRKWTNTYTVGGTWAGGDTITFTIDNIAFVLTIGASTPTTAQVATSMKQAFNDETMTDTAATGAPALLATGAGGAQQIPQHRELTASVNGSVVTLTADDFDKDITITVTKSSTSGTISTGSATTATGPRHFADDDNWSANGTPADSDDIVLDNSTVNLDQGLDTGIQPTSLTIPLSFYGYVGLPEINSDDPSYTYHENRTRYLTFDNGVASPGTLYLGQGEGRGSQMIRLDYGAGGFTGYIYGCASRRLDNAVPIILLCGTNTGNVLNNFEGDVGLAFYAGEVCKLATLNHGSGSRTKAKTYAGAGANLTACTIKIDGGTITFNSGLCTSSGTVVLLSGKAIHNTGNIGTGGNGLTIMGGGQWIQLGGGTINTLAVHDGAVFDKSQSGAALTVTNAITVYNGASILDPFASLAANTKFYFPNGMDRCKLDLGPGRTLNKDS